MVEVVCAEPKFAITPCYLLHLVKRDSFDQKRKYSQPVYISFIHKYFVSAYYDRHYARCWRLAMNKINTVGVFVCLFYAMLKLTV